MRATSITIPAMSLLPHSISCGPSLIALSHGSRASCSPGMVSQEWLRVTRSFLHPPECRSVRQPRSTISPMTPTRGDATISGFRALYWGLIVSTPHEFFHEVNVDGADRRLFARLQRVSHAEAPARDARRPAHAVYAPVRGAARGRRRPLHTRRGRAAGLHRPERRR